MQILFKKISFEQLKKRCRRRPAGVDGNFSLAGFTLLEILVAMIILSMLASGFFTIMISGRKLIARSKKRFLATEVARKEIENKRQYIRADQWNNVSSPIYNTSTWSANTSVAPYVTRYKIENVPGADYRKITVEVKWNDTEV